MNFYISVMGQQSFGATKLQESKQHMTPQATKRGRPKIMENSKRILIQVDVAQWETIKRLTGEDMSVAHFFRTAAQYVCDHNITIPTQ